jgi:hypothetical protein
MVIDSTLDQTFTGSGISGAGFLPDITINKSGGTLLLASIISVGDDWTYTAGTVDAEKYSGKVYFGGSHNIDAQGTSATMSFYDGTFAGTGTLTGNMDVANNLVINSSSTLAQGSYTLGFGGYANNGTHSGSGAIQMIGNGYHVFTKSGGGTTNFGTATVNRAGGSLTLNSPINVTGSMTFTKGILKTTSTNLLKFADNATCSGGSDSGFVRGPIIKTGNDVFTFPFGDTTITGHPYRPLGITAPSLVTDAYAAEYKSIEQTAGNALDDTLESVSYEDYYTLVLSSGSSTIYPNLSFGDGGYASSDDSIVIAYYNSTNHRWENLGGTSITVLDGIGHLISIHPLPVGETPVIVGKKPIQNMEVKLERHLDGGYYQAFQNKLYFKFDNDYNENNRGLKFNIYDKNNNIIASNSGVTSSPYVMKYKDNRYVFNLLSLNSSLINGYFILEVFDKKNEKYYLRFKN